MIVGPDGLQEELLLASLSVSLVQPKPNESLFDGLTGFLRILAIYISVKEKCDD